MRTFHRFSGAGNTFLIFDDRKGDFPLNKIPSLCGTDTDGIVLWRESKDADAEMVYFNADGSNGEMCGNGLRCFVHFLCDQRIVKSSYTIEVFGRHLQVKGTPPTISIHLGEPQLLFWEVDALGHAVYGVDTGVPHAVVFAKGPVDVVKEGMTLRYAPLFQPRGVNVNFVWIDGPDTLYVRTYERGVERETLACGTGAVASVFVAHRLEKVGEKVEVITRSGETLEVDLNGGVKLCGPTEKISEGQLII